MRVKKRDLILALVVAAGYYFDSRAGPQPDIYKAEFVSLLFLGGLALAITAGILLTAKKQKTDFDDRPPQLVKRGTYANYVIGRRTVSFQPVWRGRRTQRQESASGGKKGGGIPGQEQTVYYEDGCSVICLGPASKLHRILIGEEVIFEGPIEPTTHPSGTELQDTEGNSFVIWWGEETQPVDEDLAKKDALGVRSRWPYICRIHWKQRRLGTSATWSHIDFDVEASCIAKIPLPGSDCEIASASGDDDEKGQNGAHILYQVLSGSYPHGCGIETDYDWESLKALGQQLQTDSIGHNLVIKDGESLRETLADLLADMTTFLPEEQGKLVFMPLRDGDTALNMNGNLVVAPVPEFEIEHGEHGDTRAEFVYPDVQQLHLDTEMPISNDASARLSGNKKARQVILSTITDQTTAALVSDRRKQVQLADNNQVSLEGNRVMKRLVPGHLINLEDVGQVRVTETRKSALGGSAKLKGSLNQYSLIGSSWVPSTPDPDTPPGTGVDTEDDLVSIVELPRSLAGENIAISVLRGRSDGQDPPASVYVSFDNISYSFLGTEPYVGAYGVLADDFVFEPLSFDKYSIFVERGPRLGFSADNAAKLLDLSSSLDEWLTERQVMVLQDEIMSVRNFTNDAGNGYFADYIMREQFYTEAQQHPADSGLSAIVFEPSRVQQLSSTSWTAGQSLFIKVVPNGLTIESIAPKQITLKGKALGALPVLNISGGNQYDDSLDITFTWNYRINPGTGTGSGELAAGVAVPSDVDPEGTFTVRVWDEGRTGVVRTVTGISNGTSPQWVYTEAMRISDNMNEANFFIEVTEVVAGIEGYSRFHRATWGQ